MQAWAKARTRLDLRFNINLNTSITSVSLQGRVRTKTVKKAARQIIERYNNRLTMDFHTNKRVAEEVAVIQSKRLRNKIAGFTTVRTFPYVRSRKP